MLSKKSYIWCNIGKATLLVVVLLKHFYSSDNIADSKCYGLKKYDQCYLYQRTAKATPVCWVILYIVIPAILSLYDVAESKLFMWIFFGTK